jgi:type I site-specific restriction endonuclease
MTYESERQTRKWRIDPKLRDPGWTVVPYDPEPLLSWLRDSAIEEYPTDNGPADNALCVDGRILAIVEANKIGKRGQTRPKRGGCINPVTPRRSSPHWRFRRPASG